MEYVALLRAINVGKRRIKMDVLINHFQRLPITNVRTYIASGNVLFESDEDPNHLETRIEELLLKELEYEVATFLRTKKQLKHINSKSPFDAPDEGSIMVVFHKEKFDAQLCLDIVEKFETPTDTFHAMSNELIWKCEGPSHKSKCSNAKLERLTKQPSTIRNIKTVVALIDKFENS